jgi:DNA polymerase III delta subunit
MTQTLQNVLAQIAQGKPPRTMLVGGDSEYLVEQAFHDLRDAIVAKNPGMAMEVFEAGTDLSVVLDAYRTASLFSPQRLLVVNEVNAFVSAKEISSLYDKAVADWKSAKTDKKRASSAAKLLHVLGLVGADLEMTDRAIAEALGVADATLADILAFCRTTGRKASRGEGDAALLTEAIARGGASGTILLMRTGELPSDSATLELIGKHGAVVAANLTREGCSAAFEAAIAALSTEARVKFEARAVAVLRQRLGIERMLTDKFSRDIPDLRLAISEAARLATLTGEGGRVTPEMVEREVGLIEGGARYELGSLYTEGKMLEAVGKLRGLVAQARRDDAKAPLDIHYGRFLFPLADEIRQLIGVHSFARAAGADLRQPMSYNRFKDTLADKLGDYLKANGLVRQRPHPFPLHKKWEAASRQPEADLWRALATLGELDLKRKSGGPPLDVALETFLLSGHRTG